MAIQIEALSKTYGSKVVLNSLNATIATPGATCIMGRSGCGKTTLLHLLMGLIPADSGSIKGLAGQKVAAVFQEDRLLTWYSAIENVSLVLTTPNPRKAQELLSRLGIDPGSSQTVAHLSGGMQRRVALARALVVEPEVLFLDEPFKGLDAELKIWVMELVRSYSRNHTVIQVTHDLDEAHYLEADIIQLQSPRSEV